MGLKKKLFLARDHLGIKTTLFFRNKLWIHFFIRDKNNGKINKEIFKLENEIQKNLLNEYLVFGNIYGEYIIQRYIYFATWAHINNQK